jgi:hypothetical protein
MVSQVSYDEGSAFGHFPFVDRSMGSGLGSAKILNVTARLMGRAIWVFALTAGLVLCTDAPPIVRLPVPQKSFSVYRWQRSSIGNGAEILTLLQQPFGDSKQPLPLVSILRDSVVPGDVATSRVRYVWLLTYTPPAWHQRFLSAIPFFYWTLQPRVDETPTKVPKPLADVSEPTHRVLRTLGRDILQWTALDPMTTPVRASSRAYRTNGTDHERRHIEEAISYLRRAPVSADGSGLSQLELDEVIARLVLTKNLLGGLVSEGKLAEVTASRDERRVATVGRNWELLRTSAERSGLLFEPLALTEGAQDYGVIWFPLGTEFSSPGVSLDTTWKLLHISNPWKDKKLQNWRGYCQTRWLDENGRILGESERGVKEVTVVPLAVYSLTYPRTPLLMIDFRNTLKTKKREMTQRTSDEIVSGVLGLSHFGNWYYFAGNALYDFVKSRRGSAVNRAARLDAYSEFRVGLSLNTSLDANFRNELQRRIQSAAVNPLDAPAPRETASAWRRFENLQSAASKEQLELRVDRDRRRELARFGEGEKARLFWSTVHLSTFGLYTRRAPTGDDNRDVLARNREIESLIRYLELVSEAGDRPEVAYPPQKIKDSISQLANLIGPGVPGSIRHRALKLLNGVGGQTQDAGIRNECEQALVSLNLRAPATFANRKPQPEVVSSSSFQALPGTK